jgi:hypothetical protein
MAAADTHVSSFAINVGYRWWQGMRPKGQEDVVKSAVLSLQYGWLSGSRAALDAAEDAVPKRDATMASVAKKIDDIVVIEPPHFSKSPHYYTTAINNIYSLHPALRVRAPLAILYCLADSAPRSCLWITEALKNKS